MTDAQRAGKGMGMETPIIDRMKDESVFTIERRKDGVFCICEACDGYYDAHLTAEELTALGHELIALAAYNQAGMGGEGES